jgi:thiosulfate/3-mercaptopyruvate sulfurtransferase
MSSAQFMSAQGDSSPLVSTAWLADTATRPDLRILDCSVVMRTAPDGTYSFVAGRDEWNAAHIPGSVFLDVLAELADKTSTLPMMMPPAAVFAAAMEQHGVGEGTHVVLYDRGNHAWATRVWWMLKACGFDSASVLDGGFKKWLAEGRPTSREPVPYPRGRFVLRPRPELFVGRDEVLAALERRDTVLINALSPEEHRGEAKTRLPRAGRIPGSSNVHCQALLDPVTNAYRPREQLEELFAAAGALGAERTVTYCGGGIAATSDAFALALLGVQNVAVYDGSLAEWTADPELPLERG